jgi:hypothetical protein
MFFLKYEVKLSLPYIFFSGVKIRPILFVYFSSNDLGVRSYNPTLEA